MQAAAEIPAIDDLLEAFPETGLVLIGALPASGQEVLATHLALRYGRRRERHVYHWTWKDSLAEARVRMISVWSGLPTWAVRNLTLGPEQLDTLKEAVLDLQALPIRAREDVWSLGRVEPADLEAALTPGAVHIIDRIDDLWVDVHHAPHRRRLARALLKLARKREALLLVMASSVWPPGLNGSTAPQPIAHWPELLPFADVVLMAGRIHADGEEGMWVQEGCLEREGEATPAIWCPVEYSSGRIMPRRKQRQLSMDLAIPQPVL